MQKIEKPLEKEYPSFYHTYISKVPDRDIIVYLKEQLEEIISIFSSLEDGKAETAYAEGKWTIKELFCHIIDVERILSYRALCFARGEKNPLPGFEEDNYAANCNANSRELSSMIEEFYHVRKANIVLFSSFGKTVSENSGNANGKSISVRAIIYSIAGHTEHHKNVLKEKYL